MAAVCEIPDAAGNACVRGGGGHCRLPAIDDGDRLGLTTCEKRELRRALDDLVEQRKGKARREALDHRRAV